MRVGVNLLWLRPGRVGGSEQYITRLVVGLEELDPPAVDLTVFASPSFARAHPEIRSPLRTLAIERMGRPGRIIAESSWLARASRGLDLVHHGGGTVPMHTSVPSVLTLHDVQYLSFPATFSAMKLVYLRTIVPRSVRRARVVCVPSSFVKAAVVDALDVVASKVVVVPHGMPDRPISATGEAELRMRLGLAGRFLIYPAITYAHKNHALLVATMTRLTTKYPDLRLVFIGGVGPAEEELRSLIDRQGLREAIMRPGRVSDADRDGLYAVATALVFPSRYEGFGAPVLEAMRAGCPVLAADATALPEVVGDAGVRLPTDDPEAWAQAISHVLDDPAERARLASAGHARAARFTATGSAELLVGAYRAALAS